jgi:hypothetical protein
MRCGKIPVFSLSTFVIQAVVAWPIKNGFGSGNRPWHMPLWVELVVFFAKNRQTID